MSTIDLDVYACTIYGLNMKFDACKNEVISECDIKSIPTGLLSSFTGHKTDVSVITISIK